jgi:hypothetical protein
MTTQVTVVRSTDVVNAIMSAGEFAVNMLTACKRAGVLIAAQVNPMGLQLAEAVELGMSTYAEDFTKAGHNVRANVKDALTLAVAGEAPVSYTYKNEDKHTTAREAVDLPKHEFKAAVKAVREDNNMSRAPGAGRPVKTPVAKHGPVSTTANDPELAFAAWLHNLGVYLADPAKVKQVTGKLAELGYKLQQVKTGK